ncbi:sulfite exporter TauE/SafE family protein [Catellatospora tritici]|uniref:sulfite exporter TauE/SafE family protein n=1 Tax=Catellatospora tritici TaxID=2851566 RepID=UPI001C2D35B9|nr:sulfite exporter TauE/SafE family protein [Catellatospora tritici]MBV1849421.1 sulfite exporter TauE/SafE family protein [Catellatospora tritici]
MGVTLNLAEALTVLVAGFAAGAINAVVGSGTLVTFPVLLALGYPPVVANVSNTVGLVPGSLSGAYAYRHGLAGHRPLLLRLGTASVLGALTGGILLLKLPPGAFKAIVPVLIALALVLVVAQPWLARRLATHQHDDRPQAGPLLLLGIFGAGVYGGYFGAAQGVLLLGLLGVLLSTDLQWVNGIKNLLAALVNGVAAALFIALGMVAWAPALLLALGSVVGGLVGGRWGRRLPPVALRATIVVIGLAALVKLLAY